MCRWVDTQRRPSSTATGSRPAGSSRTALSWSGSANRPASVEPPPWPGSCMPPSRITFSVGITNSRARQVPSDIPLCSRWEMVESSPVASSRSNTGPSTVSISREHVTPISARPGLPSKLITPWCSRQNQSRSRSAPRCATQEHGAQAQHGDRFEVAGHQLGLVPAGEPIGRLFGDRAHQVVDVAVDVLRTVLGVEAAPQFQMGRAVDGQDGRRAEGVVHRRVVEFGGEQLRMSADELDVVVPGHEPQPGRRACSTPAPRAAAARRSGRGRFPAHPR